MRILVLVASGILIFSGCALFPSAPNQHHSASTTNESSSVILANSDIGRVASVDASRRFVVITFQFGGMPRTGQRLNVYRSGAKIAELKVTGPQRGVNTVADIVSGELQVNDEVRAD